MCSEEGEFGQGVGRVVVVVVVVSRRGGGGNGLPKKRRRNSKTFPVLLPEMKDVPAQGEEPGREVGLGGCGVHKEPCVCLRNQGG